MELQVSILIYLTESQNFIFEIGMEPWFRETIISVKNFFIVFQTMRSRPFFFFSSHNEA